MAQQDCGQCGYLCETYSQAIAEGKEAKLNLCAPGGKETSRMLKRLLEEVPAAPVAPGGDTPAQEVAPVKETGQRGYSRDAPTEAIFRSATRLNAAGSEKDTRHVVLDISASGGSQRVASPASQPNRTPAPQRPPWPPPSSPPVPSSRPSLAAREPARTSRPLGFVPSGAAEAAKDRAPVVLVVDDEPAIRRLVSGALAGTGCQTLEAVTGQGALEILHERGADLVVMDVQMPLLDGFDTARILKAQPRFAHLPIVFASGNLDRNRLAFALQAGATDFVEKPFDIPKLLDRVWRILTHHGFARRA